MGDQRHAGLFARLPERLPASPVVLGQVAVAHGREVDAFRPASWAHSTSAIAASMSHIGRYARPMWRCGAVEHEVRHPPVVDPVADRSELADRVDLGRLPSVIGTNGTGSMFIEPWKRTPAAMPSWS